MGYGKVILAQEMNSPAPILVLINNMDGKLGPDSSEKEIHAAAMDKGIHIAFASTDSVNKFIEYLINMANDWCIFQETKKNSPDGAKAEAKDE